MNQKTWLNNNELAIDIWEKKYRFENETFEEWLNRASNGNEAVKRLIEDKKFLFGGRILANRGLDKKGLKVTYSNCYVLPQVEDSIEGIYETCKMLGRTFSYGGGVGIDISKLRPMNAKVNNSAKETTGAVSFMDTFSQVTDTIGQRGRRGALMISIDCSHPDVEEFIDIKNDLDKVTKANISIRVTDDFMNAVINDEEWELKFDTIHGEKIRKKVSAKKLFNKLAKNNWEMAEPGLLFWDNISNYNLLCNNDEFEFAGTNPCAEEPLPAGGSCLLGSMNLSEYVINEFTDKSIFDYDSFINDVKIAVTGLNEVLDEGLPLHPLKIQQETVRDWRQIGLGVFGIAETLIKLGITYGSDDAYEIFNKIGFEMANAAILSSSELANSNGTYPKYDKRVLDTDYFIKNTTKETKEYVKKYGLRNSQILTIAPTGTLSTMLGVSGGIEPIFAMSYVRTTKSLHDKDVEYKVYTPIAHKYMKENNIELEEQLPKYFISSHQLNYKDRIKMQSAWQNHIDASISSTVNLPNEATIEDVEELYIEAWKQGLKGVTVFRDGCSRSAILTIGSQNNNKENELVRGQWEELSEDTYYLKKKIHIGCGKLNLFVGISPSKNKIVEMYIKKSSNGGCIHNVDALVIAMSGMLRLGGDLSNIEKAFRGCGSCNSFIQAKMSGKTISKGVSCPTAILNVLKEIQKNISEKEVALENKKTDAKDIFTSDETDFMNNYGKNEFVKKYNKCPVCGEKIGNTGGCNVCLGCGYSKCD